MMRILVFCSEYPPGPGGIGTHAFQITQELVKLGWSAQVLTPQDYASESEIAAFNAPSPFPIQRLQRKENRVSQSLYQLKSLLGAVDSFHPEILMSSGESAVYLSAFAKGIPVVRSIPQVAVWHGSIQPTRVLETFSALVIQPGRCSHLCQPLQPGPPGGNGCAHQEKLCYPQRGGSCSFFCRFLKWNLMLSAAGLRRMAAVCCLL